MFCQQDIDDYHSQIVYRDPDLFATGVSDLPSSTLSFLRSLLSDSPQLGQAVIDDLTSKGNGFLKNNQLLQHLYLDIIDEELKRLSKDIAKIHPSQPTPMSNEGNTADFIRRGSKLIYQMLSYMKPTPEMLELSSRLDELFKNLINLINGNECCHLDKGTLYACLLGQSTTFLIEKLCRLENQMRFAEEKLGELWSLRSLAEGLGQPNMFAGPKIQVCYTQSFIEKRQKAWNFLFFHALKGNHVLENVVVSFVFTGSLDTGYQFMYLMYLI